MSSASTPTSAQTMSGYKDQLDGLRAFCILFTVANHTSGKPFFINGGFGVDIFFALSGWLITTLLLREHRANGHIDLGGFYIRRAFRIVPLYAITLLLYAAVVAVFWARGVRLEQVRQFVEALPFLASFNSEFRTEAGGHIMGHAWTLGIEEKYYLVVPLLFLPTTRWAGLALIVALMTFCVAAASSSPGMGAYYLRGYIGLGCGSAMAVIVARVHAIRSLFTNGRLAAPILLSMVPPYVASLFWNDTSWWNVIIGILSAPLVASLWCRDDQVLARFLGLPLLAWLGRLTYAIYLIHPLMTNAALLVPALLGLGASFTQQFVLAYGVSVGLAAALHYAIEAPLIAQGRRLASKRRNARAVPARCQPR